MKNIHTNFLAEYILKLSGEYASANRIHDILNIITFIIGRLKMILRNIWKDYF